MASEKILNEKKIIVSEIIDNVKNPIDDNVYVSDFNENGKVSEKTLSKSYEWSLFTKKVDSNFYISLINDARIFEVNTSLRVLVLVLMVLFQMKQKDILEITANQSID